MSTKQKIKRTAIILIHALVGWGLCGAIIAIGRSLTTMDVTIIIHAIAVPILFGCISWVYFTNFNYTTPLQTAFIFMGLAILLDAGIIAPFAEKSFVMFTSILGTWIPFGLIFISTYLVGSIITRKAKTSPRAA